MKGQLVLTFFEGVWYAGMHHYKGTCYDGITVDIRVEIGMN